jgi:hypothetical protein
LDNFWKEVIIDILTPDLYLKTFFETMEVEITIKYLGNVCWNKECETNKEKEKNIHSILLMNQKNDFYQIIKINLEEIKLRKKLYTKIMSYWPILFKGLLL